MALPWASVALTVIVLLPKSLSVGAPEMMPVWESMCRPVGKVAEKVRASPAAGGREVAGDIEGERLTLVAALIGDGGRSRAGVADREVEALADRLAVAVGRRHRDRVVAVVAVGRRS